MFERLQKSRICLILTQMSQDVLYQTSPETLVVDEQLDKAGVSGGTRRSVRSEY